MKHAFERRLSIALSLFGAAPGVLALALLSRNAVPRWVIQSLILGLVILYILALLTLRGVLRDGRERPLRANDAPAADGA